MAFFDKPDVICSDGKPKRVRVPSNKGGTDRSIYVNGNDSGYYLGQGNDYIYRGGSLVSKASIPDFAKQLLK